MKKLSIHGVIIGVVLLAGDLGFNEGRGTESFMREASLDNLVQAGKRSAYHANASIGRSTPN